MAKATTKVRVAGAWSGVLDVDLDAWTITMLRAEVSRRSGNGVVDGIKLITGGKLLRDDLGSLRQAGLKAEAKVLATRVDVDSAKAVAAEAAAAAVADEHSKKLARIWDAAKALAKRHSDGSFPLQDYNIELEDQYGERVIFGSESDKKAVMMGLMLHANAKSLINKENYKEALDVLTMAEEAFSLCSPKFIEMIDNVPILQLDMVWCYFMIREISCLSVAGLRLDKARKGFEHSHGKDSSRFRVLNAGRFADLAIYLRLELLEGVVAYYNGEFEVARKSLSSARSKYLQLQVPDEALSLLVSMGYKEKSAKRALRMSGQDVQMAVDLLIEERFRKVQRLEENQQRQREIIEQKSYGKTPMRKAVDMQKLKELTSIGFEKHLAAEALRIKENDVEKALDVLTNPNMNCALQGTLEARRKKAASGRTAEDAAAANGDSQNNAQAEQPVPNTNSSSEQPVQQDRAGPSTAAVSSVALDGYQSEDGGDEIDMAQRDVEMEHELTNKLRGDPMADYDIEVQKEGEAIAEYQRLLDSIC